MRHNKKYEYYNTDHIHTLRELIPLKCETLPQNHAIKHAIPGGAVESISFGDFQEQIRQLGTFFLKRGFQGKHIAICAPNSYFWLLTFMAIVCSGNVAVVLDREMPNDEVRELAVRTDVAAVVCATAENERLYPIVSNLGLESFCLSEMDTFLSNGKAELTGGDRLFDNVTVKEEDAGCVFFTSGTTGKRKGVVLTHGNIASDIVGSCSLFSPGGGTYAVLPFHHAFGLIVGVLMFWHYGQCVFVGNSLKRFQKEIVLAMPDTMMLVPLFLETMYKQIWNGARRGGKEKQLKRALAFSDKALKMHVDLRNRLFREVRASFGGNLKFIICGGAPLDEKYVKEFRRFGIEVLNGFGTTECSPVVSVNRNYYHKDGTVGLSIPESKIKIADDGEILVSGPHVMKEYYGDREATDAVLEGGWYKTGDVGFVDEDGFIVLTGRKKNLIILSNGENISPESLELMLLRLPDIDEVLVFGNEGVVCAEIYAGNIDARKMEEIRTKIDKMNRELPVYQRIINVSFRETPFEKTTTKKIKR